MLVDTHAHLYWDSYQDDLDQVIQRSIEASVTTIINVGVDVELSKKALSQLTAIEYSSQGLLKTYSTIGIHPHEAINYSLSGQKYDDRYKNVNEDIAKLEKIYRENPEKIVAVGECGLDFAFSTSEESKPTSEVSTEVEEIKTWQKRLFQAQINLAKKLDLPLVVHCRDDRSQNPNNTEAWDQVLEMLGNHPAILHCYSGLPRTTNYILQTTNLFVSFAATITYPKNEYLREAAITLPLERIVLETDCPYLPPQSKRGKRNEPATVLEIAKLIAELKGETFARIAEQTTKNVIDVFKLYP